MGSHFSNSNEYHNSSDTENNNEIPWQRFKPLDDTGTIPQAQEAPRAFEAYNSPSDTAQYVHFPYLDLHYDEEPLERKRIRRKKRWPIVVGIVVALLVACGASGAVLLRQVKDVKTDADSIIASAQSASETVKTGNMDGVLDAAQNIDAAAGRMHSTTSSALWNIASFIPVLGSDVKSVQTISATLDTLANDALTPVAEALKGQGLNTLFTENGSININLLTNVCTVLSNSKPSINKAAKEMSALPDAHIAQLQTALEKAKPLVATLNDTVNAASAVAPYLPQMLGANGQTRTYVVVAQNNSELRATGGFPGSTGLLTVTNGKIELGEFSGISKLNGGEGTLPTTEVEQTMYPNGYTKIPQLITTNPDWSSTGMHVRDLWADRVGDVANGAIAVDPVFLQHLLALTGGVTLSDGSTIDGTNAATILLHNVYLEKAVPDQDPYFAEAAGAAAKQVMSNLGKVDLTALIETVAKDAKAGRVMVWMENADEENAIAKLGLEGAVSQDSTVPELGVYIDDNTWAKMSWYLSSHIEVGQGTANADGSKTYDVTVRVKNNCTTEEAQTLTHYISGYNPELKALGNMIYGVTLYAPANGTISNIQSSAGTTYAETKYGNCQVWQYGGQVQLAPQEEETLTFTITTSTDAQTELAVRTTPTAQEVAGWQ